jgi:DNA polymerase-1
MEKKKERIVFIDSNALLHRAYHALPPLSKRDGTVTNAVYGYVITLLSVINKLKPNYIVATFDLKGPTFRHDKFKDYKAKRVKAPDEFYQQIPLAKELLRAFNIPIFEKEGFEADDVIGTLVKDPILDGNLEKIIVTGDLDTLQLIDDNTKVFTLRRGINDTIIYDAQAVQERYGLSPSQMIDYKALRGDQSDNIPGVRGVGEKTAIELLIKYGTLEGVYDNLDKISSPATKKKLSDGKESAYLSYDLGRIRTDVPLDFELEECKTNDYSKEKVAVFLRDMEFFSLVKRLGLEKKGNEEPARKFVISAEKDEIRERIKETTTIGLDISEKGILGLALDESTGFYLDRGDDSLLEKILFDKNIKKVGFNLKKVMKVIFGDKPEKIHEIRNYEDVEILAYLLKSGTKIDLEKLILEEFGCSLENKITRNGQASLLQDNDETEKRESAERALWILKLEKVYSRELEKISQAQKKIKKEMLSRTLMDVLEDLEKPLVKILAKMEIAGIKVNSLNLEKVSQEVNGQLKKLEKEIYHLAGEKFNINSPSQLATILYEKLLISTSQIKKGKTGYSTDADQLRKLHSQHPIIEKIEEHRELSKMKNTYADALPKLIGKDGRIHALFNQAVTATGRLSSSEPNLQNIPKKGKLAGKIRQAFVAMPGSLLVSADYSQIDLRVAAHLSKDEKMINIFHAGKDIHRATAAWVNNLKEEEITEKQRSEAKSLNFGVLYGMGVYGFMRDSGVDRKRAEFFIAEYMEKFSGLRKFLEETKESAQRYGYVETELGRRRYIQNINSKNFQLKNMAERMAINLPIQGLSADIMKLAMVKIEKEILNACDFNEVRMILQIHDELIFEVKEDLVKKFAEKAKEIMEKAYKLKVPLSVDVSIGKSWDEL